MFSEVLVFFATTVSGLGAVTTPVTTLPPTAVPLPLNSFYSRLGTSMHRQDKKLDVKPMAVFKDVSRVGCLGLCLKTEKKSKSKVCRSFNFANRTCYLLNTFVCDGDRDLLDAPGFSYYDLVDDYTREIEYMTSRQCQAKGKCSAKCLKFKLFKTPVSWAEAHTGCQDEQAFLAMPRTRHDHETLIGMMWKGNLLQSWMGIRKREGIFYYDDGSLLGNASFWGPDQPNDSGGTQQCVQMMAEMDYLWNDFDCARPMGFVCQYVW